MKTTLYRRYPSPLYEVSRFKKITSKNGYLKLQQVQPKTIFRKKYLKNIGLPFWDQASNYLPVK